MKQTLKFNLIQQSQIIEALEKYMRRFKKENQERLELIIDKVRAKMTAYDSEEMIYIVDALRAYSTILYIHREKAQFRELVNLAKYVEKARKEFQKKHNPMKRYTAMA